MVKILEKYTKETLDRKGGPIVVMSEAMQAIYLSASRTHKVLMALQAGSVATPIVIREHLRIVQDNLELYESAEAYSSEWLDYISPQGPD